VSAGRRPAGTLLIPVENQARELDPKLLLAAVAAERGFACVVGSRTDLDFRLGRFARGTYLAKSMTPRSRKVFSILRQLGHEIAVWDEEALVTYALPEIYYGRRLDPDTLALVSRLFAWGEADAELLRKYPSYPGTPIHVTGNPRGDLLRPELRACFEREALACRREHGDFLLVNTNFGHVNAFYPFMNLLLPPDAHGERGLGRGALGMTRAYAEGRAAHKQAVFRAFLAMIPFLHETFPKLNLVVRPHPVEDPAPWQELAARHERVRMVADGGSPIPWLLSARALVHNCCTTGVEAWLLGTPSVSYRPLRSDVYEELLPNELSHDAGDLAALAGLVGRIAAGELGRREGEAQQRLIDHHLAGRSGELACERILDVIERIVAERRPPPPLRVRLEGQWRTLRRRVKKQRRAGEADSKYGAEFQRHRYPGLSLEDVRERVARFQQLLGLARPTRVSRVSAHVYRVEPAAR
jgi:surface carbohydrate biosynthesis protein